MHFSKELAEVIEAWPKLPDVMQRSLLAMIRAAST